MCNCSQPHRNPIHCILPPYMSSKLSKKQGKDSLHTKLDNQIRLKRKMLAAVPVAKKKMAMPVSTKAKTTLSREVYDAGQMPMKLGKLIWKEGQPIPSKDVDAKNVIEGSGQVWNFYKKLFNRNSIDNAGLPLIHTIRYRETTFEPYYNAFWDGEQMFYGTGDPKYTKSFTSDLDIIAHELTHGVIDFEARLEYENQSGALNESFADVFGMLVKQWATNTDARKSNWLIGENVLKGKNALRSMKAPGTAFKNDPIFGDDPQPATMKKFVKLKNDEDGDYGGVHYNSGIPNYAFFVASYELGGNAWEKTGAVWYAALTDHKLLTPKSDFAEAAQATLKKTVQLFGKNSLVEKAITKGWTEAGVI